MSQILRSRELPVPAARAWALVGQPASISDWHPAISESPVAGNKRECTLADGARIEEEIRAHDDAARSYTYVITGGPLPVKDYAATIKVEATGAESCRVEWSANFEPLAPAAEVEAMVGGVYDAGLDAVVERLRS
jgi:uncharacterized protein YndB with AHSA1/START domain